MHDYNGATPYHPLHRMTADYRCVDCHRSEADLYLSGATIIGFDELHPPRATV